MNSVQGAAASSFPFHTGGEPSRPDVAMRKLKYHEQKLLKKVSI